MSTPANPLPRKKKLGTPKTSISVEPGWVEDEEPETAVDGPGQQYPMSDQATKQKRKLQRS